MASCCRPQVDMWRSRRVRHRTLAAWRDILSTRRTAAAALRAALERWLHQHLAAAWAAWREIVSAKREVRQTLQGEFCASVPPVVCGQQFALAAASTVVRDLTYYHASASVVVSMCLITMDVQRRQLIAIVADATCGGCV